MRFINCTPHPLTITGIGTIDPSGIIARVGTVREHLEHINWVRVGVRVVFQDLGDVTSLPDPVPGSIYIVSAMVLAALKDEMTQGISERAGIDVFAPDTGPDAVRDAKGQIVSVLGLVC